MRGVHPNDTIYDSNYMQRKSKGMELLKQVPSLPAGKAMDGFVEEGAFGRVIRFGFQGNRKTQGREEGNTGKRKVQLSVLQ